MIVENLKGIIAALAIAKTQASLHCGLHITKLETIAISLERTSSG